MRPLRNKLLLLLLAAVCVAQSPVELVRPEIRRVGDKLACKCGSCASTVGSCPMLQCHYSHPARQKIDDMQKQGKSDEAIIQAFIKQEGLSALAAPPAEGFSLLSWVMPFVAILFGLALIWLYIKRFRKPAAATSVSTAAPVDERYRERIEKELSELE
ncbi:MAG TPA: cytochrome c-type biogenesis protein CcmH [Bryobacteraceae bacterium]|nr:cytochrome c-type biogenesis protein CcmH [Bryobacteraceae bacterium]